MPDGVVIFVGLRVVRVVPVHEIAEPFRLLCDACGEMVDTGSASLDELVDAECFDVAFRLKAHLFFDFNFDP